MPEWGSDDPAPGRDGGEDEEEGHGAEEQLRRALEQERHRAAARRFFNNAVAEYNSAIQQIPAVLFSGALGFLPRGFFELPEAERAAIAAPPQVQF